jgi:hypothetical protein
MHSFRGKDEYHLTATVELSSFATGLAVKMPADTHRSLLPPSRVAVTVGTAGLLEVYSMHPLTGKFFFAYRAPVSPNALAPQNSNLQCVLRFEIISFQSLAIADPAGEGLPINPLTVSRDSEKSDSEHPPAVVVVHSSTSCVEIFPHASIREMKYHPSHPNFFCMSGPRNFVRNIIHPVL